MKPSLVSLLLLVPAALAAAPLYQVVDLGSLGGSYASINGINASGQTVGTATDMFGNLHAVFSSGGQVSSLAINALGAAINDAGQMAGTRYANGQAYATQWDGASSRTLSGPGSYGMGINQAGQVAGMTSDGHAFLSSASGDVADLGTLAGGTWTAAYDVNNARQVAGYGLSYGGFRGFLWDATGGFTTLGTLGGKNSYATAVNDAGLVSGHAQLASGYLHATLWDHGAAKDLGTLGGGSSYAYDVNSSGQAVGYSWTSGGVEHAFLYQNGLLLDLNNLVGPSSGWVLTSAYALNDNGQIGGSGYWNGEQRAFRLDLVNSSPAPAFAPLQVAGQVAGVTASSVPEPGTWWMMLAACAFCAARSHRLYRLPRSWISLKLRPRDT
ncbi:MAG: PEP-CTERM sorting domain-containing protein [Acidobacteriota bacterium]